MFTHSTRNWYRLLHSRPGRRFQNFYRRTHRKRDSDEVGPRVGRLVLGGAFLVVAAFLFFLPLVYVPFLAAGAAMLASESPRLARALDRGETWARDHWVLVERRLGDRTAKLAVWVFSMGCLVLAGRACYNTFIR
jgi:hypothetical protein